MRLTGMLRADFVRKPYSLTTLYKRVMHHLKYKKMLDEYKEAAMVDSPQKCLIAVTLSPPCCNYPVAMKHRKYRPC